MSSDPGHLPSAAPGNSVPAVSVEDRVERAVEAIIASPSADTCLDLVADLEQLGALWEGVLVLLGPTVGRPRPGLSEHEAVARLRKLAATPDRVSSLVYGVWAAYREHGASPARELWETAPIEVRRGAALQMLIVFCRSIGGEGGRLTAEATVQLIRATVPITW
ncbi:hypothetical protein [Kitasatospora sp. NPDC085879]|uniref:hypothetical protein n=1 Tax=Kitasatospora sp. NPDC085879 TaxID=3154769 RepID=UPI000BB0F1B4|nr:hypothetical protein [Streptomyces sp. TLI_235]PBC69762.1 hypothetical protein BX265_7114 [Streptomyces sp. TLI_235]